jgi:hypothetical protein
MATTVSSGSIRADARAEDLVARQQIIDTARGKSDASFWMVLPLLIAIAGWDAYGTWSGLGLNRDSLSRFRDFSPMAAVIVYVFLAVIRDRLIHRRLDAMIRLLESSGVVRDFATKPNAPQ